MSGHRLLMLRASLGTQDIQGPKDLRGHANLTPLRRVCDDGAEALREGRPLMGGPDGR